MYPKDRNYSTEHEWVQIEDDGRALVGITEYAQEHLGDVVFVELPEVGTPISQFQKIGEIESVKAVSELYSPMSGEINEVNDQLLDNPELINDDPYQTGWLVRLSNVNDIELGELMTADEYENYLAQID
jgi:glycine cleavage system H protein